MEHGSWQIFHIKNVTRRNLRPNNGYEISLSDWLVLQASMLLAKGPNEGAIELLDYKIKYHFGCAWRYYIIFSNIPGK